MPRIARALATTGLIFALFAVPASAQDLRQPSAGKALKQLVRKTSSLPGRAVPQAKKQKLLRASRSARRSSRRRPCRSVNRLERYRRVLRGTRLPKGRRNRRAANRLTALGPLSVNASRALLAKKRTRRCGGGVRPSKLEDARFELLENDVNGMRLRVRLPALRFVGDRGGRRSWTRLALPNTDSPGPVGEPGIPMASSVLGVPDGATVQVRATDASSYTIDGVDVFPRQPESFDQAPLPRPPEFAQPPFEIDRAAYRTPGETPSAPADGAVLGQSRDLTLGNLRVAAAQYDARARELEVFNSVDVTVTFEGGSHSFSEQLGSPWERPQRTLAATLLNADVIRAGAPATLERCGEEMLVITNPSTLAAANQFATARRAAGIRTSVVQTGAAPGQIGTTPSEIQAFIRGRLTAAGCIHPSYVTLMGDDELVPVFPGIGGIESDLEYSLRDGADEIPDVALGRIPADDATGVTDAVTKIVNYENAPPDGEWLRRATIAAEFQDDEAPDNTEDRTFITFAEVLRTGILTTPGAFGLSVDRIYATYPPGSETVDPQRFNDGTPLPPELRKPAFPWDGDTADISAAWNDGRYLMVHRNHGGVEAWDNPFFHSTHADALTNGAELPVVLSINCSSGAFQDSDTAWATRALVNPNGGAVGVFGDTEISPSWHNTQIAWGFADALLPRVLPTEGPAEKLRVGNALINGKTRLAGIAPPAVDGNTRRQLYLWHYFGDPSMQMWGGEPIAVPDLSRFEAVLVEEPMPGPDPPPYSVLVTLPTEFNGEAISLLREGQVIGKAIVAGGQAQIPAAFDNRNPNPGDLRVAMEADGAVPVSKPVDGVRQDTKLTTTCPQSPHGGQSPMTTSGKLEPGFAGAKIVVRYTPPSGSGDPFERTVTTDANGNWSDTVVPNDGTRPNQGLGQWRIEPRFDGDASRRPSSGQACTVQVN